MRAPFTRAIETIGYGGETLTDERDHDTLDIGHMYCNAKMTGISVDSVLGVSEIGRAHV